jgi:ribulose-5-phosphate 4-epimerase/fuculose-1-phosphate aldolase
MAANYCATRRATLVGAAALLLAKLPARADDKPGLQVLIDDLVAANHILYYHGVVDGFGHISFRSPADAGHFHMAAAIAPGRVTAGDIVELGLDGNIIGEQKRPTYSERFIHAEIYRARADVDAVVHTHSPTVIPFGVTGVPLKPITHTSVFLASGVPVFDTRDVPAAHNNLLVDSPAVGKALAEKLGQNAVVLMRGHGDTIVAGDIRTAVARAIYTEVDARLLLEAIALGKPITYISPEEAAALSRATGSESRGSNHGNDRIWQMWLDEASGKVATIGR